MEYFLETMQKFDNINQGYDDQTGTYNVVQDSNVQIASLFDSTLLHRFLLAMVVVLLLIILRTNSVI